MKLIKPRFEIIGEHDWYDILKHIEKIGRTCYQSHNSLCDFARTINFVDSLIKRGHESILEFYDIEVRFICDRAIANQIVRQRICSFVQSSTRYCNYSKDKFGGEITCIDKGYFTDYKHKTEWINTLRTCEEQYLKMIEQGYSPERARDVLPLTTATELVVKTNLREWRHILKLRTAKECHPDLLDLTVPLLKELKELIPIIFDDIV